MAPSVSSSRSWVRSPGVYFTVEEDPTSGRDLCMGKLIPSRGAWLEFETSSRDVMSVKVDRKRKIPVTTLLRALPRVVPDFTAVAKGTDEEILALFQGVDEGTDHRFVQSTLDKDPANNAEEALLEFYRRLRPGDPPNADNARSLLNSLLVRSKGDLSRSKPIWFSEDTRERLSRYVGRERSKKDVQRRTRLDQLGDDEPIFLSNRKQRLGYSGFLTCFRRLLRQAQRHFQVPPARSSVPWVALPDITPHTIRHLHTTFRVKDIRARFSSKAEREAAFDALVSDMGWRTAAMLKVYDHAITRAEMKEQMANSVHQWVENAAHDRASLEALLLGTLAGLPHPVVQPRSVIDAPGSSFVLTHTAREGLAWLEELEDT
jgi:DNA-directed RNA polymerase beta subunit